MFKIVKIICYPVIVFVVFVVWRDMMIDLEEYDVAMDSWVAKYDIVEKTVKDQRVEIEELQSQYAVCEAKKVQQCAKGVRVMFLDGSGEVFSRNIQISNKIEIIAF